MYSYDPEMYRGGYIRLSSAKVTVYRSGKYIIPGIKSQDLIQKLWEGLVSVLRLDAISDAFTRSEAASETYTEPMESAGSATAASSDGFAALSGTIGNLNCQKRDKQSSRPLFAGMLHKRHLSCKTECGV